MRWTTKKEQEKALAHYNNKMSWAGKFGTLEEQRNLRLEYTKVWNNYKATQRLKKIIFIAIILFLSWVGYNLTHNKFGVEEVESCGVTNSCTFKNQY